MNVLECLAAKLVVFDREGGESEALNLSNAITSIGR